VWLCGIGNGQAYEDMQTQRDRVPWLSSGSGWRGQCSHNADQKSIQEWPSESNTDRLDMGFKAKAMVTKFDFQISIEEVNKSGIDHIA